jgi:DNA-binding PadR family transcriptional regulator
VCRVRLAWDAKLISVSTCLFRYIGGNNLLPGLLKMWMLKIISEKEVSGYEIIKKVDELTGKKPSTGSVYPLLKSMRNEGWIIGKKLPSKTIYQITDAGTKVLKAHDSLKGDYAQRISRSFFLAHDTFEDLHLVLINNEHLINPLITEISRLLANGIQSQKIKEILDKTMGDLQKLE